MEYVREAASEHAKLRARGRVLSAGVLMNLEQAAANVSAAQADLDAAAGRARRAGVSWEVIAAAAGISRDTARRRYGGGA